MRSFAAYTETTQPGEVPQGLNELCLPLGGIENSP
jgi:hypothetical protein